MMMPRVTRLATRWRTVCSRSSSSAFTRMLNSPSARLSRIRLPRLGSIEVNSFASIAAAMIPAGLTLSPLVSRSERLSRIASAGSKSGSRCSVLWSRLSSALPIIDISAGGRSPCAPDTRLSSTRTVPAWSSGPAAAASETRCATSPRNAPASYSSSGWPIPARMAATSSPSPSPIASSSLTTLSCRRGATEPTMPRSSSASRPSSVTIRLPGCGSACRTPWSSIRSR